MEVCPQHFAIECVPRSSDPHANSSGGVLHALQASCRQAGRSSAGGCTVDSEEGVPQSVSVYSATKLSWFDDAQSPYLRKVAFVEGG